MRYFRVRSNLYAAFSGESFIEIFLYTATTRNVENFVQERLGLT